MHISILLLSALLIGAFVTGALVAWNNSKSSLKGKIDADLKNATGAVAQALSSLKAKL